MRKVFAAVAVLAVAVIAAILLWPAPAPGLVVYAGLDYAPAVVAKFTQDTGIKVSVVRLSTGSLMARIAAQGHHPDWDLAWFDGATAAASLDQAGLLAHDLPAPENLTAAGKTMLSPNGAFIPTGVTLAGVYIDDPQRMAAPPASWSDLTKPTYQGQIGMNDPSISGPTYPMLAGMLDSAGGWPQGKTYVEALKANGLHMFAKNDATLAALQARSISLAIVQSSAAIYFAATHPGLAIVFPKPAYLLPNVMVEAAGLSRAKRADATKFMAFVMRPDIQKLRQTEGEADGDYWPITTDAPAPLPGLPPLASLDTALLNPAHWGGLEDTINRWFSRTMAGG